MKKPITNLNKPVFCSQNKEIPKRAAFILIAMVERTGIEPVTPTMST